MYSCFIQYFIYPKIYIQYCFYNDGYYILSRILPANVISGKFILSGNKIFARRSLSPPQAAGYYGRACTPLRGGRKNCKTSSYKQF
jgi:hypothetical protein